MKLMVNGCKAFTRINCKWCFEILITLKLNAASNLVIKKTHSKFNVPQTKFDIIFLKHTFCTIISQFRAKPFSKWHSPAPLMIFNNPFA